MGHRSPSRAAARFGRARQLSVLSSLFASSVQRPIWEAVFGARLALPGVPGRAAAHPAHAALVVTGAHLFRQGSFLFGVPGRFERGPGLEASGAPARAAMSRRLYIRVSLTRAARSSAF